MNPMEKQTPKRAELRRRREREQRYQTILGAAETLFAEKGYHQTGMEQIADRSEVSVGTVYFYFKNKEDLIAHMLENIGFQLRELLGTVFKNADGTLEGFRRAGMVFFEEFCSKHPARAVIFFRESTGLSELLERRRKKIFDKLIADVQQALMKVQENLGVAYRSGLAAEVMAVSIMGMYERIAYHYLIWDDRSQDLTTIARDAVDFIVGGIHNLCE